LGAIRCIGNVMRAGLWRTSARAAQPCPMPPRARQHDAHVHEGMRLSAAAAACSRVLTDFNHLNNVLISRDYRKARLIDIDGASKGSIQSCTPTELEAAGCDGQAYFDPDGLHKPALEVDLSLLLPLVVQQLLLGKGRGIAFVNEQISSMRRAPSEDAAKALIYAVVCENFPELCTPVARREASSQATAGFAAPGPAGSAEDAHARGSSRHATKLVDWFYAMVMKRGPWTNWTNDIYDAMRCIDHLPIR